MNAEELYGFIKEALDVFDLAWNQKGKITVTFYIDSVSFSYKNKHYTITNKGSVSDELPTSS